MTLTYPYNNFYEMLKHNASTSANKKVVFVEKTKITNTYLFNKVNSFSSFLLSIEVQKGDIVALIAPNSVEFIIATFAAANIGATVAPINTLLKNREYEFILNDSKAKVLVTSSDFKDEVQNLPSKTNIEHVVWMDELLDSGAKDYFFADTLDFGAPDESYLGKQTLEDSAVVFYTSGTTGSPKGVELSYKNLFSNMIGAKDRFDITKKDRFVVYLPMFHAFTFTVMVVLPFFTNSSSVIIRSILPFSNIIKQTLLKRVTIFLGVPDIYNALIRAKLPWYFLWFNSVRIFISGAAALNEDTLSKFKKVFKRGLMLEGYGLSECSPAVCVNPREKQKTLSVGVPLLGYEVKIVDDELIEVPVGTSGELIVKGDCVMKGYLHNALETEKTIINGWLRTGDIAKVDEDGYIYMVDRMKDLIISKGINIYPRQIEEVLTNLPYIKASAVIGKKDPNSSEVPIAFVELEEDIDTSEITQNSIKAALKEELANFKIPKTITFLDELPKNATGKVLKRILKEEYK